MAQLDGKRIVIAGGSGFLGLALAESLHQDGANATLLSRNPPSDIGHAKHVRWNGRSDGAWQDCLNGADGLVNLAGRSVDCIKTPDHRDEIHRSRVESTRALGRAIRAIDSPPPVWVQMSTAHIYGDPPTAVCTEDSEFGTGLAPDVGKAWEHAFNESVMPSQRAVILRTVRAGSRPGGWCWSTQQARMARTIGTRRNSRQWDTGDELDP